VVCPDDTLAGVAIWDSSLDRRCHRSALCASTKTLGTLVHGAAHNIDWRLVGLLAAGSVPATIVSLIILSTADLDSAIARRMMTVALGAVLLLTSAFYFSRKNSGAIRRSRGEV
jgi:uncharacterized membrane protein YfcA